MWAVLACTHIKPTHTCTHSCIGKSSQREREEISSVISSLGQHLNLGQSFLQWEISSNSFSYTWSEHICFVTAAVSWHSLHYPKYQADPDTSGLLGVREDVTLPPSAGLWCQVSQLRVVACVMGLLYSQLLYYDYFNFVLVFQCIFHYISFYALLMYAI